MNDAVGDATVFVIDHDAAVHVPVRGAPDAASGSIIGPIFVTAC
jgi:hypothetical protein